MTFSISFSLIANAGCYTAQGKRPQEQAKKNKKEEFECRNSRDGLIKAMKRDQNVRRGVSNFSSPSKEVRNKITSVSKENSKILDEVIKCFDGWPTKSEVGQKGQKAAWLIAQHADSKPGLQKRFLRELREAVQNNEAPRKHLAYLEDRVRVRAGKKQIYGTQFRKTETGFELYPVKNKKELEKRRRKMNLAPINEYKTQLQKVYEKVQD